MVSNQSTEGFKFTWMLKGGVMVDHQATLAAAVESTVRLSFLLRKCSFRTL